MATGNRFSNRPHKSTAVRVGRHIFGEQVLQCSHISLLCGVDKSGEKATLLCGADRSAATIRDMFAGAGYQLADVGFFQLENLGDLRILVVERLSQYVCGAFGGGEFLEKKEN